MAFKNSRKMENVEKKTRRLHDLGITHGQGDGTWSLVDDWFEVDDSEFSIPFMIVESFEYKDGEKRDKFGFGIVGEDIEDQNKYYISFPATDKTGKPHSERQKLFQLMQDDNTPITGCVMQRVDTGKANPFVRIISVEQMQEIQASETDESEDD